MPNTREKLIEVKNALSMCYKQGITSDCKECAYRECNNVCMDALMEDALAVINHLEEKQATSDESKWIPVTERLPAANEKVLGTKMVADRSFVFWGKYYHKQWFDLEWNCYRYGVTHWMPLPEPPKGE